jgi:hypothetical protein
MATTTTIPLKHPIKVNGQERQTIELRRPKVSDYKAASRGGGADEDKEIRLVANLAQLTPAEVEELDMADMKVIQETLKGFIG